MNTKVTTAADAINAEAASQAITQAVAQSNLTENVLDLIETFNEFFLIWCIFFCLHVICSSILKIEHQSVIHMNQTF